MSLDLPWITTHEANLIMDVGICDATFRLKFRDCIRWKLTPGGHYRWLKVEVQEIANTMPKTG
jgi:hypothetical protein